MSEELIKEAEEHIDIWVRTGNEGSKTVQIMKGLTEALKAKDHIVEEKVESEQTGYVKRVNTHYNAVVTQLFQVEDDECGSDQYRTVTHIECKNKSLQEPLQQLATRLMRINSEERQKEL